MRRYEKYQQPNKRRKNNRIIIGCLATLVVIVTALALMLPADTLQETSVTVYQVNKYSDAKTTLIYGGSVQDKLGSGMSFLYWHTVTVEKTWDGQLYVASYNKKEESKLNEKAETAGGFVLLLYDDKNSVSLETWQKVTVDFDYTSKNGTSAQGYGKVIFGTEKISNTRRDNSGKLTVVEGADTQDLIEVNLYDYGSNINKNYESNQSLPGFQQDGGTKSLGSSLSLYGFNFGNNITSDLSAGDANVTKNSGINSTVNKANSPISGEMSTTLIDGYPALKDGTSLKWLFSDNEYATKKNKNSINGLFLHNDTTGAYTFNSRENHAQFNASDDTFTLYNQIITSNFMMYPFGNFLPFNDIVQNAVQTSTVDKDYFTLVAQSALQKYSVNGKTEYSTLSTVLSKFSALMDKAYPKGWNYNDCMNEYFKASGINRTFSSADKELTDNLYSIDYDIETDFYFGMEMKMNFYQPKGGLTGNDGKQPMVFYFTGDDDVWVYVDGILFLDLSGIHRHVGGEIDFVNGVVKYYELDVATGDVASEPYKTVKFSELVDASLLNENGTFKDFSKHSFNFYYMERGSGSGVCRMNFNFPLLRENSVTVAKEIECEDVSLLGNPDFKFQVLKEGGEELYIGANTEYSVLDSVGKVVETKYTDENGIFTVKAGQTAVFNGIKENTGRYFVRELLDENTFAQYGTIKVDGNSQTENYGVTVGGDSFTGVNSPVKDISDGSTVFHFNNAVDISKLGKLTLKKTVINCPSDVLDTEFAFNISFDGIPIKVGSEYTVNGEKRKVETEGMVKLKHGEIATFEGILAGSRFKISETEEFSEDYSVKYTADGLVQAENYASGIIKNSSQAEIEVINTEIGISVEIPVTKELRDFDGKEYTFKFILEQVTDISGKTLTDPPVKREVTVNITDETQTAEFVINYPKRTLSENEQKFYYRITEQIGDSDGNIEYDKSVYVAEVTVESQNSEAQVTELKKGGVTVQDGKVLFVNRILRYELPATGGNGLAYYLLGIALVLFSVTGIISYKRKSVYIKK